MFDSQNNNLERALEWIFSRPELEEENEPALDTMNMENNANILAETGLEGPRIKDGSGSKFSFGLKLAIMLLFHTYSIHRAPFCFESSCHGVLDMTQLLPILLLGLRPAVRLLSSVGCIAQETLSLDSLDSWSPSFLLP